MNIDLMQDGDQFEDIPKEKNYESSQEVWVSEKTSKKNYLGWISLGVAILALMVALVAFSSRPNLSQYVTKKEAKSFLTEVPDNYVTKGNLLAIFRKLEAVEDSLQRENQQAQVLEEGKQKATKKIEVKKWF